MRRGLFLSIACAVTLASPVLAQPHYISALEYSVGIPVGATHKFLPVGGWSGAAWESRWMEHPHTTIGFLLGFNEFYRRSDGTFTFPQGAATGDQYRHLDGGDGWSRWRPRSPDAPFFEQL